MSGELWDGWVAREGEGIDWDDKHPARREFPAVGLSAGDAWRSPGEAAG